MQLTLEEAKKRFPNRPQPAPLEYAGQWVAWNKERTKIIAHGANFGTVHADAISVGCPEPVMQRVLGTALIGKA
jgi:hypothetical protein